MEKDLGFCNFCKTPSVFVCSRCYDTYCSIKCQQEDWQTHRYICMPFPKLIERSQANPHLLALPKPPSAFNGNVFQKFDVNSEVTKERNEKLIRKVELPRPPKHSVKNMPIAKSVSEERVDQNAPFALISTLITQGIMTFTGKLGTIFNENFFSVVVNFPQSMADKYDDLMKNFDSNIEEFKTGEIGCNSMIVVKDSVEQKFVRAIVVNYDLEVNAAVIYYCDIGTFDFLMPVPADIKLCSQKYTQMPGKSILVEVVSHAEPDRKKFLMDFFRPENVFSFNIEKKRNGIFNGQVSVNEKVAGHVCLYESTSDIDNCKIAGWKVKIIAGTKVTICRIDPDMRAWIVPSDKKVAYERLLYQLSSKLEPCKTIPEKNCVVVHIEGTRGVRLMITNHLSNDLVEGFDFDNGQKKQCQWKKLLLSNEFIRNLPFYGRLVTINDGPQCYDVKEMEDFLQNNDFYNNEFILKSIENTRVKLVNSQNESLGELIKNFFDKKEIARKIEEEKKRVEQKKAEKAVEQAKLNEEKPQKKNNEAITSKNDTPKVDRKIFAKDMNIIPLEIGKTSKFIVTSGFKDGFLGVCPDTSANHEYLQNIIVQCENFISNVKLKDLVGYRPQESEMCLVRYTDGAWYRAQCLVASENVIITLLVDFGTVHEVEAKEIMRLPETLIDPPPRSHFVSLPCSSDKAKTIEEYGKYRFKVESFEDDMYTLSFA
ncbi:uncharacterized protein LOC134831845 isoform X2 [Culicoides brevitarsis]|uniref:uncharacterized protein LOC134831845 isoform X2 n=1 Tax=Culicoides brevitarsis TaxID=469753 RepID=UPI00307C837F